MALPVAGLLAGGAAASLAGGILGAGAAGDASQAQLEEQRRMREEAKAAAKPTAAELKALNDQNAANTRDLERREKLLASSDPALIEAGRQALGLLQGKEVKSLDPIRKRREQDREKLKQRLRDQLGPGFETSTAGAQALNQFDQATDENLFQAQSQQLGQLLGVAQNVQGLASTRGNVDAFIQNQQAIHSIKSRQVNAITGTPITATPGKFVQQALLGQTLSGIGGAAIQGGLRGSLLGGADPAPKNAFTGTVDPKFGSIA